MPLIIKAVLFCTYSKVWADLMSNCVDFLWFFPLMEFSMCEASLVAKIPDHLATNT